MSWFINWQNTASVFGGCSSARVVQAGWHQPFTMSLFSLRQILSVEINLEVNKAGGAQRHPAPPPPGNNTSCRFNARSARSCTPMCAHTHTGTGSNPQSKGQSRRQHLHIQSIHRLLRSRSAGLRWFIAPLFFQESGSALNHNHSIRHPAERPVFCSNRERCNWQ